MHVVAASEVGGRHEQQAVIAVEQVSIAERPAVEDGCAASTDRHAHRLDPALFSKHPCGRASRFQERVAVEIAHPVALAGGRAVTLLVNQAASAVADAPAQLPYR